MLHAKETRISSNRLGLWLIILCLYPYPFISSLRVKENFGIMILTDVPKNAVNRQSPIFL